MSCKIQVFYQNHSVLDNDDINLKDASIKEMTFYHINCLSEYYDKDLDHTFVVIHSNGEEFISVESEEDIDRKYKNSNIFIN